MLGEEKALPPVGYGIREFEAIVGLARRMGYAKVKSGEVQAFLGLDGKLKVSPLEAYAYLRSKETLSDGKVYRLLEGRD